MSRFIVTLKHPNGSLRKVARERKSGEIAITAYLRTKTSMPHALFDSAHEAKTEVEQYIKRISEFIPDFPHYELIIQMGTSCDDA